MSDPTFDRELCTLETCSVEEFGRIAYIPTLAGNAVYLAIFCALLVAQGFLGIRYRTWSFLVGMVCGMVLEIVGYAGRVMLHDNIFGRDNFVTYLIGTTVAPAFITAAVYICLGRIITIFSVHLSLLKPKWITIIFVIADIIALVLQAGGGAITSSADDEEGNQLGIDVMIAGLASQVVSLVLFCAICGYFAWRVFQNPSKLDPQFLDMRRSFRFKGMLFAIGLSVLTILIRSIFRLIELQEGFDGELANKELDFMILEGPMIFIGVIALTVWHPGYVLGHKVWVEAGFRLFGRNSSNAPAKALNESTEGVQDV